MFASLRTLIASESGAVSTDWVVLTGAMAALAVTMMSTMHGPTTSVANEIETVLTDVDVATLGAVGFSQ